MKNNEKINIILNICILVVAVAMVISLFNGISILENKLKLIEGRSSPNVIEIPLLEGYHFKFGNNSEMLDAPLILDCPNSRIETSFREVCEEAEIVKTPICSHTINISRVMCYGCQSPSKECDYCEEMYWNGTAVIIIPHYMEIIRECEIEWVE